MTVSSIGSLSNTMLQSILDMRSKLDDLQRQLGSGMKSTTYAGLGVNRGVSMILRSQLDQLSSYNSTIANVGVRLGVAQSALDAADGLVHVVKNASVQSDFTIDQSGKTGEQRTALGELDQLLALFNTRAGDRYLFSGAAVDQPAVASTGLILDGDVARAGLKQVMAERLAADLGANGLGRLNITAPTATSVAITEDAVSPFGLKLNAINSTLSGATVTGPAGSPAAVSIDLTANAVAGQKISVGFTLPDGSSQTVILTASNASPPGDGEFAIGASAAATAGNLQTALTAAIGKVGKTSLTAASAMAASDNFFNTDSTHPPQRVSGPPFDTATTLVDGSAANTVQWYIGEDNTDPARSSVNVRIDQTIAVNYGIRANEQALRIAVQNMAVFAAASFSPSDPDASDAYTALGSRVGSALDGAQGQQKVADIGAEIASAQQAFETAKDRHRQTSDMLTDLLQNIEGVSQEDVGAQILSLQTSLQASLQTTALLSKMSLVNFLPM